MRRLLISVAFFLVVVSVAFFLVVVCGGKTQVNKAPTNELIVGYPSVVEDSSVMVAVGFPPGRSKLVVKTVPTDRVYVVFIVPDSHLTVSTGTGFEDSVAVKNGNSPVMNSDPGKVMHAYVTYVDQQTGRERQHTLEVWVDNSGSEEARETLIVGVTNEGLNSLLDGCTFGCKNI